MRNNYLLGLGGALLATTSLSGAASAATVYVQNNNPGNATGGSSSNGEYQITAVARPIGAQLFGTGGLTATSTLGPATIGLKFSNTYGGSLKPSVTLSITGANFATTSLGGQSNSYVKLLDDLGTGGGTLVNTLSGASASCAVGVLSTQIQINACAVSSAQMTVGGANASFAIAGMSLSGVIFTGATGLATAGSSITLSGSVYDSNNPANVFESITATNVVTSVNQATVAVLTSAATVNQGTGTVPFVTISQGIGGFSQASSGGLTVELAAITITGAAAVGADLTTFVPVGSLVGGLGLVITSAALADPAISNVRFVGVIGPTTITATTLSGTATFTATQLTAANLYLGSNSGTSFVQIEYNGTTSITGGAANPTGVVGTFAANGGAAFPAITGTANAITRSGFSTQINSVLASSNTAATSYVRIVNGGAMAGAATITVNDGSTGAKLGAAFTTASIPVLSTLQLSASQIETSAGFTPTAGETYTLSITGPLNGYVQHVTLNPGGVYTDFSGRRAVVVPTVSGGGD